MTTAGPYVHSCHVCGDPRAPFGFGWPGPLKDRPDDTIIWGCTVHRAEVERINKERTALYPPRAKEGGPSAPLAAAGGSPPEDTSRR